MFNRLNMCTIMKEIYIMCGETGSGKSTVAKLIANAIGTRVLVADEIRRIITRNSIVPINRYSRRVTQQTYQELLQQAEDILLRLNKSAIVLDATFLTMLLRGKAKKLARRSRARLIIIECKVNHRKQIGRLVRRNDTLSGPRFARNKILSNHIRVFEKVIASEADEIRTIRTDYCHKMLQKKVAALVKYFSYRTLGNSNKQSL